MSKVLESLAEKPFLGVMTSVIHWQHPAVLVDIVETEKGKHFSMCLVYTFLILYSV